jgi:hypothetical protein
MGNTAPTVTPAVLSSDGSLLEAFTSRRFALKVIGGL